MSRESTLEFNWHAERAEFLSGERIPTIVRWRNTSSSVLRVFQWEGQGPGESFVTRKAIFGGLDVMRFTVIRSDGRPLGIRLGGTICSAQVKFMTLAPGQVREYNYDLFSRPYGREEEIVPGTYSFGARFTFSPAWDDSPESPGTWYGSAVSNAFTVNVKAPSSTEIHERFKRAEVGVIEAIQFIGANRLAESVVHLQKAFPNCSRSAQNEIARALALIGTNEAFDAMKEVVRPRNIADLDLIILAIEKWGNGRGQDVLNELKERQARRPFI